MQGTPDAVLPDPRRPLPASVREGGSGAAIWLRVTGLAENGKPVYRLRPDEMFHLEAWCKAADRIEQMEEALATDIAVREGSLYTPGTGGAVTANPMLAQIKGWYAQAAAHAKAVGLPDLDVSGAKTQKQHQSEAAKARWGKKPATG